MVIALMRNRVIAKQMPIIKALNMSYLIDLLFKMRYLYIADRPGDGDIKEGSL
jgi:hypothetical protein